MLDSDIYATMTTPNPVQKLNFDNMEEEDSHVTPQSTQDIVLEGQGTKSSVRRTRGRPPKKAIDKTASTKPRSSSVDTPSRTKRTRARSSSCILCLRALDEETLQCQMCNGHSCHPCTGLPADFIAIMKSGTCPWICRHCNRAGLPTLKNINENVQKQGQQLKEMKETSNRQYDNLDRRFTVLEESIDRKIEAKMKTEKEVIKSEIEDSINTYLPATIDQHIESKLQELEIQDKRSLEELITKKVTEIVSKIVDEKLEKFNPQEPPDYEKLVNDKIDDEMKKGDESNLNRLIENLVQKKISEQPQASTSGIQQVSPKTYMKNTVHNVAQEMKEKEKRIHNIIIFGMEESKSEDDKVKKEEDKETFMKFVSKNLKVELEDKDIKDNYRLRKSDEPIDESKSVPLLVTMQSTEMKDKIFRNLFRLRGNKDVTFSYDYTEMEREINKKKIAEAQEMTKNDPGAIYRVRGPPWGRHIVRIVTKEQIVESAPIQMA